MLSSPRHRLQVPVCPAQKCNAYSRRAAPLRRRMRSGGARAGRARGVSAVRGGVRGEGGGAAILGAGRRAAAVAAVPGEASRAALRSPPGCAVPVPPPGGFLRSGSLFGRARAVAELLWVVAPWALVGGWGLQAQGREAAAGRGVSPAAFERDARVPAEP